MGVEPNPWGPCTVGGLVPFKPESATKARSLGILIDMREGLKDDYRYEGGKEQKPSFEKMRGKSSIYY
jgi:hypothetical protein